MSPLLFALLLQDAEPPPEPLPPPPPVEPAPPAPPPEPVYAPDPVYAPPPVAPASGTSSEPPPRMSEGRRLVSAYNDGFHWGISPGVVFSNGSAGFAISLGFGYGIDTGPLILVPGLRVSAYFTDPSVYLGMPEFKVILPIDRFAPFVEGGVGAGYVGDPESKSGVAVMGGGGFVVYFEHFAIGAEASYQTITGTSFHGIGLGPILAIAF